VAVWTTFVHGLLADIPAYEPTQDRHAATAAHIAAHIVDPASYVATTGAAELLLAARDAGVRCAVVSNFDHLLLDILSELRFLPLVDGITFSGELGFYKPDRRVFDTALRALNAAPGDSLMVGDSAYSDVNGARAAGIDAVLFDPHGRAVDHDGPRIQHLMDALNFL
jgi:putative hydrolase of the HAD superfamily